MSFYYMAESTSEQDKVNPAFFLATWVGNMGSSCVLGISHIIPTRKKVLLLAINNNCNKSFIDQAYSVNMAGYCLLLFCIFIDLDFVSVYKKKEKELDQ